VVTPFLLQLGDDVDDPERPMSAAESAAQRKVVLLVEDNDDARELYAAALREAGYYVVEAEDVASAQSAVDALSPDVVVLDCRLPDGDGLAVLQTWRASRTSMEKVPVIILTASAHRQDVEAALLAGADQFVPKPCPANVLALHVKRALDGTRPSARLRRVVP
jgi:DNA-binding response OmpR family regulator